VSNLSTWQLAGTNTKNKKNTNKNGTKFQRPLFDILSDIICVNNKTLKQQERDEDGKREKKVWVHREKSVGLKISLKIQRIKKNKIYLLLKRTFYN